MLIDMVPTMPECIEDARVWAPKSYEQHFQDSVFTDKALAILAYQNAPPQNAPPQSRIDRCSAIINGHTAKLDQSAVDALFD